MTRPGIDYDIDQVSSPVAHADTVRTVLANAVQLKRHLVHMDMKQAFLSSKVRDQDAPDGIFIQIHKMYRDKFLGEGCDAFRMTSQIYGYPTSSFHLHRRVTSFLTNPGQYMKDENFSEKDQKLAEEFKFEQCIVDPCLYRWTKRDEKGNLIEEINLTVYIDDIICSSIGGIGSEYLDRFKNNLSKYVCEISLYEPLKHALGMRITHTDNGIALDQIEAIDSIYEDYKHFIPKNYKRPTTPMAPTRKCDPIEDMPKSEAERNIMKRLPFRSFLQRLMQVTTALGCKQALGIISRNQINPGLICWFDLIRVMCFMYDRKELVWKFERTTDNPRIVAYSDSDWSQCTETSRSVGGGIILWGNMILRVFSKRQTCIARSSSEAELYACDKVAIDCERFMKLLQFLGWPVSSFKIYVDNKSTINLCKRQPGSTKLSRAFRLRTDTLYHFHTHNMMKLDHISGLDNPADGYTKNQSGPLFVKFMKFLYPTQL